MKKGIKIMIVIFIVLIIIIVLVMEKFNMIPKKCYYAADFNITIIKSNNDFDADGIDDYADILQGAKIEAINKPKYKSAYYIGGYPPEGEGVCTDVI